MALAGEEWMLENDQALDIRLIRVAALPLIGVAPHTLLPPAKSSRRRALLWLICAQSDHLRISDLRAGGGSFGAPPTSGVS
jgi:hypothetical protein